MHVHGDDTSRPSDHQWLLGPLLTVGAVLLLVGLNALQWGMPTAAPILLVVTFAAYMWGVKSGLASAFVMAAYSFAIFTGHGFAFPSDGAMRRAIVVIITGFAIATLMGLLRTREKRAIDRALRMERALAAESAAASRRLSESNRALKDTNHALQDANRALEAFSYTVAHDLRTPLRGIEALTRFTLEDDGPRLSRDGRAQLERVFDSAQRMTRLLDDVLTFSRAAKAGMEPSRVELCALARDVASDVQDRHPERRVRFTCYPGEAHATGDARLLRLVLVNLMDNAWKFTRERDPHATVEFGALPVTEDEVSGSNVAFFVRDNGAGFDPARAHDLFQEFQRLHDDREFQGTGVGLATVRRIIERHGGTVWAEGRPGEGATFYFTLGDLVQLNPSAEESEENGNGTHPRPEGDTAAKVDAARLTPQNAGAESARSAQGEGAEDASSPTRGATE